VVQVDNVTAAQLVPILRPLVPQQGHLAAYPATNVLIISDRADNVDRLVQIIRRIDLVSDAEIELITLQHASAVEVVRILTALSRTRGGAAGAATGGSDEPILVADERTNSVMLGGERAARLRLRALISHLDTPLERGGNTHVIYLRYAKAAELVKVLTGVGTGIQDDQGGQEAKGDASSTLNIQADESSNAVVITAPPDVFRSLQAVIRQLDIRRAQVHIDAVIAEITQGKDVQLGVQWRGTNDLSGNGAIGGTSFSRAGPTISEVAANPLAAGSGLSVGYFEGTASIFGTEFLNIGALLQALASDSATNILSTPSLVTLDNQEAEIVVAENVPFLTGSFTSTGTGEGVSNPFQTIQRQDVGLTLRVTPQINEGNAIQLEIEQESSSVKEGGVPGASDITTNKRSIKTTVLVEDRQMVVLGGLIDDSLQEQVDKVPLLGDLPVLGNLFKSRSTKKTKRNLMVFIQPSILRDAAVFTETSSGKYNYMRGLQGSIREKGVNLLPREEAPMLQEFPELPPGEVPEEPDRQVDE
jgi:general secretion pathway protein D